MGKNRLEGFSDRVLAIIITVMVLQLKVPRGHDLDVLRPLLPVFLSYVLSFVYIGIYWNKSSPYDAHCQTCKRGSIMGKPAFAVLAIPYAVCRWTAHQMPIQ